MVLLAWNDEMVHDANRWEREKATVMADDPPFGRLRAKERTALFASATKQTFENGQHLIVQGKTQKAIYVIGNGEVRIERRLRVRAKYVVDKGKVRVERSADGEEGSYTNVEIARLGRSAIFGEMSFLDHQPVSANVIAVGTVDALRISDSSIKQAMKKDPSFTGRFYHSIAEILVDRLRATSKRAASRYIP
jgi:CRP-like cAMP-binding protein